MDPPRLTPFGETCAGAVAGALSRSLVAPLDVLKIRFQLQSTPARAGVLRAAIAIVREEGVRALWRGNGAALVLWSVFAAVQFPVFGAVRRWTQRAGVGTDASTLLAGASAGGAATLASYPLDWTRTALAAQRAHPLEPPSLRVIAGAARGSTLRAGLAAALLAVVPATAITFWARGVTLQSLRAAGMDEAVAAPASGATAGVLAKVATFPLDTVKKRQQIGALPSAVGAVAQPRYAGVADALRRIVAAEGGAALFRGLSPALMKAALSSALIFSFYDFAAAAISRL
jgi:solute carrier family 25 thiamine pyrophosphate transporter 19